MVKATPSSAPRPMNCFMTFRLEKQREIVHKHPGANHRDISKIIAKWWKELTPEEQEPYRQKAELAKSEHNRLYPEYKFRPKKKLFKTRTYKKRSDNELTPRDYENKQQLMALLNNSSDIGRSQSPSVTELGSRFSPESGHTSNASEGDTRIRDSSASSAFSACKSPKSSGNRPVLDSLVVQTTNTPSSSSVSSPASFITSSNVYYTSNPHPYYTPLTNETQSNQSQHCDDEIPIHQPYYYHENSQPATTSSHPYYYIKPSTLEPSDATSLQPCYYPPRQHTLSPELLPVHLPPRHYATSCYPVALPLPSISNRPYYYYS